MDSNYLVSGAALTATADKIRSKRGITTPIAWNSSKGFSDAINAIQGCDFISHADIPAYVKSVAMDVAAKAKAVQTANTITFIAMSDFHHCGEQADGWATNINAGNLHACMAAKVIAYSLPNIDFACMLGDVTFGNASTTPELLKQQIGEVNKWLDEAYNGIPQFRAVGNHDVGEYSTLVGAEYLFSAIGKYNAGAVYGSEEYGYCYRDFESKKLRVICLNTCEGETTSGVSAAYICSPAQRLWFAQTLYSVGSKTDAASWSVLVLGHYPLDYGGTYPMSNIVKAYVEGSSTIENGTTINFSGHNAAKFVANVHGHTHCFRVDKLYSVANSVGTAYDAKKVTTPNACYYRNNASASANFYGFDYGESTAYDKTANTANDTAFTVNVIDPSKQVLYSFCYGAGYDRVIGYGATIYHSITNALTHTTNSNAAVSVEDGTAYSATIAAESGYTLATVTVTMGGTDVTSSAYNTNTGIVSVAAVTGDVVITATATKVISYTNLVDTAVDSSGASAPYTDGKYINSSGTPSDYSGFVLTGFIPIDGGNSHLYRIGGSGITWNEYGARIAWYNADFTLKGSVMQYAHIGQSQYYPVSVADDTVAAAFQTNANVAPPNGAAYFRVSAKGNGTNLIITLDEPIE